MDVRPEYNIKIDIQSAQKLFRSGVPIQVAPLDETQHLVLDDVKRRKIFTQGTPLTDSLLLLYGLSGWGMTILHDAIALASVIDPDLCPTQPLRVTIDNDGITRADTRAPNSRGCLGSDSNAFFDFYMQRPTAPDSELDLIALACSRTLPQPRYAIAIDVKYVFIDQAAPSIQTQNSMFR